MNINLLTIDSTLAVTTGASSVQPKPDEIRRGTKFSLTPDDKHPQVDGLEKPKADNNINEELQKWKEPISKSPQEFTQSIHKRPKSENPRDTENKTKSKEKSEASGTIKPPKKQHNLIKRWLAEHIAFVQQGKEGAATNIVPKAGQQIAQMIVETQTGKSPSVTGHAVKSAEIKLLHTTEKGQLGLKTVLPAKSNGQNGLKTGALDKPENPLIGKVIIGTGKNTDKVPVSAKTIAETKPVTEKGSTKELTLEVPDNTGKSTTTASGKTPTVNINVTTDQAKTSEKPLLQPAGVDPDKPVPAAQTDAKATSSQNISNLSNPNGKEAIHAGNDIPENQSVQKLNIAAAQVSTGQIKDQSASTSNKSPSQGFEQMLSQNSAQTIITEQPLVSAKNTTTNPPGQPSSSETSADIGKQIFESVQKSISQQSTDHQITVRLNPPELGKVLIRFQQQDTELTGLMEVSKAQTRFEIEQTLPQIIRNLADCGIQIKRLEVTLSNEQQSGQGAAGNQSLQSGTAQQQNSSNPDTSGYDTDVNQGDDWLASTNSYENLSESQEVLITDGSIDMLV